jgi:hypothetical protein
VKPWVQTPVLPKNKNNNNKKSGAEPTTHPQVDCNQMYMKKELLQFVPLRFQDLLVTTAESTGCY